MNMSERITYLRQKKGWSQSDLARNVKIGQSTLHGYESGARAAPGMSVEVAARLARAFGVTLDYLYGMYDDDPQEQAPTAPRKVRKVTAAPGQAAPAAVKRTRGRQRQQEDAHARAV